MKNVIVSVIGLVALAGAASAQVVTDSTVSLQTRIVNITGSGPRLVGASNGTFNVSNGAVLRFRVEYRLQGSRGDGTVPGFRSGLSGGLFNITGAGAGTSAPVTITGRENGGGSFPNPASDGTNLTSGTSLRTGMNGPFRGGFSNANNNADLSNGVLSGSSINSIVPLTISNVNQGAPGYQDPNGTFADLTGNEWYSLYTFTFTAPGAGIGSTSLTAAFAADPGTGNKFAYFIDGQSAPVNSDNAAASSVTINYIPAPAAASLLGLGGLVATRRRRA